MRMIALLMLVSGILGGCAANIHNAAAIGGTVTLSGDGTGVITINPNANLLAKEYRHFYGMAGAIIPVSEGINLMPAVLLKYVKNAPPRKNASGN